MPNLLNEDATAKNIALSPYIVSSVYIRNSIEREYLAELPNMQRKNHGQYIHLCL